jgi:RecJ-like exonuclease
MADATPRRDPSAAAAADLTSVAGEEDPGAADDLQPARPGDESPPGTAGTAEGPCPECGGSGRGEGGARCPSCDGAGTVTVNVGDA